MQKRSTLYQRVMVGYLSASFAYGLWVFIILQFKECGLFSSCPDLHTYSSVTLQTALIAVPDTLPYSAVIAFGRGLAWLPSLTLHILGHQEMTLEDWIWVNDVPTQRDFYQAIMVLLP